MKLVLDSCILIDFLCGRRPAQEWLKLPDAIILATARTQGATLATRNTRDFPADDPDGTVPYAL